MDWTHPSMECGHAPTTLSESKWVEGKPLPLLAPPLMLSRPMSDWWVWFHHQSDCQTTGQAKTTTLTAIYPCTHQQIIE